MKKILLTLAFIATGVIATAQVGVNNVSPQASLDVSASPAGEPDGVLVPRVTVAQLNAKSTLYAGEQNGALVFVTAIAGATGKTSEVTATGFHYYSSAAVSPVNKWLPLGGAAAPAPPVVTLTNDQAYNVLATDTIIEYTNINAGNWILPSTVPVGKIYYIASTAGQISFADVVTTAGNTLFGGYGTTLLHLGGGRYAKLSGS